MTTHRSGPPAEHLRIYARSLGLPEDADLATVVAAIRACRAAGVARPDQIPTRALCTESRATMANHPAARDCRTATLAAKAASKILTAAQILAASAEELVAFAASLLPRELDAALYAVRADEAAVARLKAAAHAAAFGVPMLEPAAPAGTASLAARRRAYMALAVDWRNQPALTSEIGERVLAMAVAGDLLEFIGSISDADLADLYRRLKLSSRTKQAAEALYAAAGLRAMAERYAAPLAHVAPPADNAPELPTAGKLSAREKAMCAEFGTDERVYLRMRDERDAKNAKADAARLARRTADRAAVARAAASLRGAK
ncbi:MAG: hypothetical protein IPF92_19375 [Myxococcales bacterium]|nr:hypothetical protein [Myxococcales bacterium]